ncbi:MAG: metal/formaldehyde-sensitive transcriptional repressor [Gammaproteobacteria bacterium]|nr:metal/formaldehyde-sensitive transcriptional repressor [Gammaproteobacteria bacterium]
MTHTTREKAKLLVRVRRIRGQVDALERALESEQGCTAVLQQIAAVRGAINGLMAEVVEDHIQTHLAGDSAQRSDEHRQAAEDLIDVVRTYFK